MMLIALLKSIAICTVCLLQYGIVLLNLDKIYILKQFVNLKITTLNSSNTNKVEEPPIHNYEKLARDSNGFPII